jgi:BioD-like phosphotransacetylase family protein
MPDMSPESQKALEEIARAAAKRYGMNADDLTIMVSTPVSDADMERIMDDLAELKAERDGLRDALEGRR